MSNLSWVSGLQPIEGPDGGDSSGHTGLIHASRSTAITAAERR
jgi:hypothetical protein